MNYTINGILCLTFTLHNVIKVHPCCTMHQYYTAFFQFFIVVKCTHKISGQFSSVQSLSRVRLFEPLWIAARQASLSNTNSQSSLKLTSIELVMPSSIPFSSCPQSLPASESFPMSQLFTWVGQSIGVSALASFLPKNIQDWSPLEWTGWISLQSKGPSRVFSNTTVQKHQFFSAQLSSQSNPHIHTWPLENHRLD